MAVGAARGAAEASTQVPDIGGLTALVVEVAERRLGLPAEAVVEILPVVEHAPLPHAPAAIEGIVDVRGEVLPVLALRTRLGLPHRPPRLSDHLVLVRIGSRAVGVRVDRAVDLVDVTAEELRGGTPLPGGDTLLGLAALPEGLLLIHDPDAFLSHSEAADLERALQEVSSS